MPLRLYALRVKIKSLAAEARYIRHEEDHFPNNAKRTRWLYLQRKLNEGAHIKLPRKPHGSRDNDAYRDLHDHRTWAVRREARASLLAYALLRHRPYRTVEPTTTRKLDQALLEAVARIAANFGTIADKAVVRAQVDSWIETPRTSSTPAGEPVSDAGAAAA